MNSEMNKKKHTTFNVGSEWRSEISWKILNVACKKMNQFDTNTDFKFILFNLSDFHIFEFKKFYDQYVESKYLKFLKKHGIDAKLAFQERGKLKEYGYILKNQSILKSLKAFYTGFIFFEIYESKGYEVGNLWIRNFRKKLDQDVKKFIRNIKKKPCFVKEK